MDRCFKIISVLVFVLSCGLSFASGQDFAGRGESSGRGASLLVEEVQDGDPLKGNVRRGRSAFLEIPLYGARSVRHPDSTPARNIDEKRIRIDRVGMGILAGWSFGNIATGAMGWAGSEGEQLYFHQMNVFWNTVNLGIAAFGMYNALREQPDESDAPSILRRSQKTERILLINTFLDIGYVGAGVGALMVGNRGADQADLWRGYGKSLILQGGFLFLFDLILYRLHRRNTLVIDPARTFRLGSASPASFFKTIKVSPMGMSLTF